MEITILGSAAAEGWPALFCACETCKRAREVGGKNIRSRAGVQFGKKHRVDLSPDTWFQEAHLGADLSALEYLFVSHSHDDHWQPHCLAYLRPPFAHANNTPVHVYGNEAVIRTGRVELGPEQEYAVFAEAIPLEPIRAGEMTVTPIVASHMVGEQCLNYLFSAEGKNVLCAWDTSCYEDESSWSFLENVRLDCVILECTCGPTKCERYHMDFEHYLAFKERVEKARSVSGDCIFVATHFSHNVGILHEELEQYFSPHGVCVAYDGMKVVL